LQNSVNHRIFERKWRCRVLSVACLFECQNNHSRFLFLFFVCTLLGFRTLESYIKKGEYNGIGALWGVDLSFFFKGWDIPLNLKDFLIQVPTNTNRDWYELVCKGKFSIFLLSSIPSWKGSFQKKNELTKIFIGFFSNFDFLVCIRSWVVCIIFFKMIIHLKFLFFSFFSQRRKIFRRFSLIVWNFVFLNKRKEKRISHTIFIVS